MSSVPAKRLTPTQSLRAIAGPYRDKLEKSDAARGKLEGRLRRAFDVFDEEMRDIWGEQAADATADASASTAGTPESA